MIPRVYGSVGESVRLKGVAYDFGNVQFFAHFDSRIASR